MGDIFFPLQGPTGLRPKAPSVGAWQSPGYEGYTESEAFERYRVNGEWFGMRCDNYVVIDCDDEDSADAWMEHTFPHKTWVRKTPRGFHFIYLRSPGSPDAPAVGVYKKTDIRAGRTSQIVFYAPCYYDLSPAGDMIEFVKTWLPEDYGKPKAAPDVEWDEMPFGVGNNTMTAIAGVMRRQGMGLVTMARCLGAINRITMPSDPMAIDMIVQIAQSVARYDSHPDIDIDFEDDDG